MIPFSEKFARLELLIGKDGLEILQNAKVAVAGVGAVGSYAIEAFARSGLGTIIIADFDTIHSSNINRQLIAMESTIGQKKIEVAQKRIHEINPLCNVKTHDCFIHTSTLDDFLEDKPDIIIDAIDSLNPKVELLDYAGRHNIPIISSMGAALRIDATKVRIAELKHTKHCPLARLVRKRLRRRKANIDFKCVYSLELPRERENRGISNIKETSDLIEQGGRKRNLIGSMPTLPGIFGLIAANEAIMMILQKKQGSI